MGIGDEFARYKAELDNRFWAVSAEANGQIVMSLWNDFLKAEGGRWIYTDRLSRWSGHGNRLFAKHLEKAWTKQLPIRIVVARTDNIALVRAGGDASTAKNTFKARPEWIGRVQEFDGDAFKIVFEKQTVTDTH